LILVFAFTPKVAGTFTSFRFKGDRSVLLKLSSVARPGSTPKTIQLLIATLWHSREYRCAYASVIPQLGETGIIID
jgi:hypothetical protein